MKECETRGLAGVSCRRIEECLFKEALKVEHGPKDLVSLGVTVERNQQGCKQSGEVLAEIVRRIRGGTPGVGS